MIVYESVGCYHQSFFLSPFLYMTDMTLVLELTFMVPSFSKESQTSKREGASSLEKSLWNAAVRSSLLEDLFAWEFIELLI